jgi:hypothetical protein
MESIPRIYSALSFFMEVILICYRHICEEFISYD